jgi:hypothetical protein
MGAEGAGGLSITAIERCIDNWETETQDGAEIPAAHAELAALVERAGRVAALEGTLLDETARRLWTERVLQDRHGSPVGWDWDVGPAVREHWTRVARERLGYARTVETLAELLARRGADAGRAATLAAENAALREALVEFGGRLREIEGTTAVLQRAHAAPADAGPGAAGVRDETTALAVIRAELATPLAEATKWHHSWREAVGDGQPRLTVTIGALQRIADALDAPRAGGAGEA